MCKYRITKIDERVSGANCFLSAQLLKSTATNKSVFFFAVVVGGDKRMSQAVPNDNYAAKY